MRRRHLLASAALFGLLRANASAAVIAGAGAPAPDAVLQPPAPIRPGAWRYFTAEEGRLVEAIVDRLIPADALSVGGHEAGCATFIDAQLAGPYGHGTTLYMRPPFQPGTPEQGPQISLTPAAQYRVGLTGIDRHCEAAYVGRRFAQLAPAQQDAVLTGLERGTVTLPGVHAPSFFSLLVKNTREGFLADPIYGGNRDMAGWKMIGFPGARYDYRAEIRRPGETLDLPPVGLLGRDAWHAG